MNIQLRSFALALAGWASVATPAAVLEAGFAPLGGNDWQVSLSLVNDGTPAAIQEFTLAFALAQFSNLSVLQSPAGWDSLVVQGDPSIPADGYFDSLLLNNAVLGLGQRQDGFQVRFTFAGPGAPSGLSFDIVDPANFQVLASGITTPAVPEPAAWMSALAGVALLGWRLRRLPTTLAYNDRVPCGRVGQSTAVRAP